MKKGMKLLAAMGAMMLAACSSEETITDLIGEQTTVTYTVSLPADMSTRAYSDGETATYLTYAVYRNIYVEEGKYVLVDEQLRKNQFVGLEATVSLQLLKGYSYTIVFWADAGPKCPYTIDLETGTITMDYAEETTIVGNNEERDAFYKMVTISELSTAISEEVELTRPFAQLNFGTNDLQADIVRNNAPVGEIEFSVEVPEGLPTTLSLIDGKTSGSADAVTFVYTGVPAESDGTFPVEGYEYVSMNYFLASEDASVLSSAVTLTATHTGLGEDGVVCTVNNVPLQRNYRTNIYGSLLTAPATYNITIEPAYLEPDNNIIIYEGVQYTHYIVSSYDELTTALQAGGYVYITLSSDIPNGTSIDGKNTGYVLDLNGHTLTINTLYGSGKSITVMNGTINATLYFNYFTGDIVISNCVVNSSTNAIYVYSISSIEISNCDVTVKDNNKGVTGIWVGTGSNATAVIKDCTVTATGTSATGLSLNGSGTTTVDGCTVAATGTEKAYGVDINYTDGATYIINNSTITAKSDGDANGVYCTTGSSGNITITNCTITPGAEDEGE